MAKGIQEKLQSFLNIAMVTGVIISSMFAYLNSRLFTQAEGDELRSQINQVEHEFRNKTTQNKIALLKIKRDILLGMATLTRQQEADLRDIEREISALAD